MLTAKSYTKRFSEDLEDVFPHVVFPASFDVFNEAARIGALIRAVETFTQVANQHLRAGFVELADEPFGAIEASDMADGALTLCANGSGRFTGIPFEVWKFEVSGYRVLPNWLSGRKGLPATNELAREFRDICGRIAMLLDLARQADTLLDEALRHPLTRAALGQINPVMAEDE